MVTIAADDSAETEAAIRAGLESFNDAAMGFKVEVAPLTLAVRDDAGTVCGGIIARTYLDTLYFDVVWMDDSLRGQGVGRDMMMAAEDEGRRRGARHAWLVTLSWQAKPFYEKLGYRLFGEMPVVNGEHARYFMQKAL